MANVRAMDSAPRTQRLFIAIFPPEPVQEQVGHWIESLRTRGDRVGWAKRQNLHFTLRFLGERDEVQAQLAVEAMHETAAAHAAFECRLGAAGAFPEASRARVLWLGLREGGRELRALAAALEQALAARGFDRDDKPFTPHLTIGRLRAPGDWRAQLAATKSPEMGFPARALLLVVSTLAPGGSRYEIRERALLGT